MFKALYPFKSHFYDLNGQRLHFLDEGQGEPVVMVHGNPTWSFYYRDLIKALSPSYRIIAPDHIGCGFSSKPADTHYNYTLTQRIDDLASLLESLNIRKNITLVLHDWGGMIGMGYATRYPERINKIILLNTAAFHLPTSKRFPLLLGMARTRLGAFFIRRFNAFSGIAARVCVTRHPMSRAVRQGYTLPYDSWDNRIATLRFVQDIPLKPTDISYQEVSRIADSLHVFRDTPIQICWGDKDFVFDRHFLHQWQLIYPHAEVHRFSDCGHYILEDATEEVVTHIQSFLLNHDMAVKPQVMMAE